MSRATATAAVAKANPRRCTRATRIGTSTMPPTLAPVSARVMARPWRRPNQGRSVLLSPVELRHDHEVAITTYTAKSCQGAVITPSSATAPAIVTTP